MPPLLALLLLASQACTQEQGTRSTTDTDAARPETTPSPTAATSSAGSSGMGGATNTHALAADTIPPDSANRP